MRILAIDPGLSGGIAWDNEHEISAIPMPANDGLDLIAIAKIIAAKDPNVVVIERVQNRPGEDKDGDRSRTMGASSMFKFGQGYGSLQGLIEMYRYTYPCTIKQVSYPTPQQWKSVILPGRTRGKQGAIDYCGEQFPQVNLVPPGCRKPHDGMADALCLLRYGQKLAEKIAC